MELLLKDGDYVSDGAGGQVRLEGEEALLQRVLFRLTARRGGFPLMPELGSRLYALEGVENCRLSAPAADLAADSAVLPVLGTLTVTKLEA